jgi:hypothetical protein
MSLLSVHVWLKRRSIPLMRRMHKKGFGAANEQRKLG